MNVHLCLQHDAVARVHLRQLILVDFSTFETVTTQQRDRLCGVVVSVVRPMNEVTLRRARLVLGSMTIFGRVYHLGM